MKYILGVKFGIIDLNIYEKYYSLSIKGVSPPPPSFNAEDGSTQQKEQKPI